MTYNNTLNVCTGICTEFFISLTFGALSVLSCRTLSPCAAIRRSRSTKSADPAGGFSSWGDFSAAFPFLLCDFYERDMHLKYELINLHGCSSFGHPLYKIWLYKHISIHCNNVCSVINLWNLLTSLALASCLCLDPAVGISFVWPSGIFSSTHGLEQPVNGL